MKREPLKLSMMKICFVSFPVFFVVLTNALVGQEMAMSHEGYVSSKVSAEKEFIPASENYKPVSYKFILIDLTDELNAVKTSELGVHYFGEDIARKETVFTQLYTYQVPVSPGSNATKTVIRKPAVYVAVNKLFKYYKKSTKNGDLTYNKAAGHYDKTLNIALSIFYQQSEDFEEEVSKIKDIEDLAKLFEAVVLISQ